MSIKGILEGLKNTVFVKEEVEKIALERTDICRSCKYDSLNTKSKLRPDEHCTKCGCNIHMKTRALSEACPILKWKAIATDEEDSTIQKVLDDV